MLKASIIPYSLEFIIPGGTSRGILKTKDTYFLILQDGLKVGIGECALFKGLSYDDVPTYENKLQEVVVKINNRVSLDELLRSLKNWPSIQFGVEMAFKSLTANNQFRLFQNDFSTGKKGIEINGLVWMGDWSFMKNQLEQKIEFGFSCIKIKIGAIDFESELDLLRKLRKEYSSNEIEIRVDANGAFTSENVRKKLAKLAEFDLHSIEQPIKQGQAEEMARLCESPDIPIALDEELIGVIDSEDKKELLNQINPQFVVLKPALLGGFAGTDEWIELAQNSKIGWWVTSALESNIGLNAIAQYVAAKKPKMPQGLGTGQLFSNNIPSPLELRSDQLWYGNDNWDLSQLEL